MRDRDAFHPVGFKDLAARPAGLDCRQLPHESVDILHSRVQAEPACRREAVSRVASEEDTALTNSVRNLGAHVQGAAMEQLDLRIRADRVANEVEDQWAGVAVRSREVVLSFVPHSAVVQDWSLLDILTNGLVPVPLQTSPIIYERFNTLLAYVFGNDWRPRPDLARLRYD